VPKPLLWSGVESDPLMECAPEGGRNQAAALTPSWACGSSNCTQQRSPSTECSRLPSTSRANDGSMKSATHTEPAYLVRLGALISGQVQAIDEVPPANFRSVQQDHRLQVVKRENPGVNRALFLNTTRAPFEDVRVRQAFQSAVDVASAVKAAYFGSLNAADKNPRAFDARLRSGRCVGLGARSRKSESAAR
jgi:hypothetical protein